LAQEASVLENQVEDNILSVLQPTTLLKKSKLPKNGKPIKEFSLEHIRTIAFYCLEENVLKLHDAWLPIPNYLT
jgi:hypothetical protein